MPGEKLQTATVREALAPFVGTPQQIKRITRCQGGLFNASFRILLRNRQRFIVQFSPTKGTKLLGHEKSFLRREKYFLGVMRKRGLPVPKVLHHDFSKRRINRDLMILEYLEGHTWHYYAKHLLTPQNNRLYRELGAYAKKIHEIRNPRNQFGFPPPYRACKSWSEFFVRYMKSLNEDNKRYGLITIDEQLTPYYAATQMMSELDQITTPHLLHGDLWPRNVLIRREGKHYQISGLLDTERGMWGDPRFEWVFHGYPLGRSFWTTYGKPDLSSRGAKLRELLYQSFCCYQASLELMLHFRKPRDAAGLKKQTEKKVRKLLKELENQS